MTKSIIRWGIAGLGNIAHRFAKDLTQYIPNAELYAVAARDEDRASQFSHHYHCQRYFSSYEAMAKDTNIDVVYIATIHPFHKPLVSLFLNHGKHVLVEKPAFTNVKDWDEMSQLSRQKGLLLAEAMKTVTFPAYQAMKQYIKQQEMIINSIEASFGNWHAYDQSWHLFDPNLSGGATLDVGVYGLWLFADLCQWVQQPIPLPTAFYTKDNPQSQVDENVRFEFDGIIKGQINASITRDLKREAILKGPDLEIIIHDKWWNPRNIDIRFKGEHINLSTPAQGGGFEYEIEHITALLLQNKLKSELLRHDISRSVCTMMEQSLADHDFEYLT
ncbi:Gfo/Idh/MocA family protein [Vibrio sagamiensis]|uniref:Oxidoreductase n=1 Tax=Vibrio sagamiensis NBRC 104589 TaxID=1219064 RepID=A0A511QDE9_9VIBR|nr:Gfo/Idh/MocA family oxidoreductase [Vibrio sagamiensis]PNQ64266.1 gfo/Idh/MocA family oxidoreductase [Vibrio agarivorans]GEM75333.1 oxidoreductase [Vibrio sagamiensis NBRC 104589]